MRREAYVPLSQATLKLIRAQQQRTADRFPAEVAAHQSRPAPRRLPDAGLKLTRGVVRNPDGTRLLPRHLHPAAAPLPRRRRHHRRRCRPAAITSHQ